MSIELDPAPARITQFSLLERALPSPETLSTLTARLSALVGESRVGSAVLLDTHRPDAFAMTRYAPVRCRCYEVLKVRQVLKVLVLTVLVLLVLRCWCQWCAGASAAAGAAGDTRERRARAAGVCRGAAARHAAGRGRAGGRAVAELGWLVGSVEGRGQWAEG